jgi:molecular chaperone DnaK
MNAADALIFSTEKQLKEYGDKIPADKKAPIEAALAELKVAHEAKDFAKIDSAMQTLNNVFQAASQDMYANTGGAEGQPQGDAGSSSSEGSSNAEAEDVDFEEVKDK